jgi:hypothetical protein
MGFLLKLWLLSKQLDRTLVMEFFKQDNLGFCLGVEYQHCSLGNPTPTDQKWEFFVGVQVDYNVVHLWTSLVQLFVLLLQNFEKVVQMIELKRFGGAPNGYPFAPLIFRYMSRDL